MGAEYESLLAVRGMMYSRKLPAKYNPVKKPEYWDYMNMKNAKGKVFYPRVKLWSGKINGAFFSPLGNPAFGI
jgi:hypothetical protein